MFHFSELQISIMGWAVTIMVAVVVAAFVAIVVSAVVAGIRKSSAPMRVVLGSAEARLMKTDAAPRPPTDYFNKDFTPPGH
jgi:hypothetical protein